MDGESVAGVGGPGRKEEVDAEAPGSATPATTAAEIVVATTDAPASIDLNALHKMAPEELVELARKFGVLLQAARARHYQILDLARAALGAGLTVTAEGLIDQPVTRWHFCAGRN